MEQSWQVNTWHEVTLIFKQALKTAIFLTRFYPVILLNI